eukprot:COSAG01_NODE_6157_length_3819_cov_274.696505_2_plen_184_part_00
MQRTRSDIGFWLAGWGSCGEENQRWRSDVLRYGVRLPDAILERWRCGGRCARARVFRSGHSTSCDSASHGPVMIKSTAINCKTHTYIHHTYIRKYTHRFYCGCLVHDSLFDTTSSSESSSCRRLMREAHSRQRGAFFCKVFVCQCKQMFPLNLCRSLFVRQFLVVSSHESCVVVPVDIEACRH